jgi:hypothetical protein
MIFRGDIALTDLPLEALRRRKAANRQKEERRDLENIAQAPARLTAEFASISAVELLTHFRERNLSFFPANVEHAAKLQHELFPAETKQLIAAADAIAKESRWELAGLGTFEFNAENFWRRDPITCKDWGLDYHGVVATYQNDGADIRMLWELNRFGHTVTLACAYAATGNELYAEIYFSHVESWSQQNPYGRGANWNCAMEVALRAINLLAAFDIFRRSPAYTEERLVSLLKLFDQHGRFILDNNEFSYIATSNHYLSDVVGLFWIGTLLPELAEASKWKEFGLSEMLREMDKQILPDGADFEASTGYHKFVTEMFLYSFILARRTGVIIEQRCIEKLRSMLLYLRNITRPDGGMALIGDADGSQTIPMIKRDADDAAYLLSIGAVFVNNAELKLGAVTPEIVWLFGESGMSNIAKMDERNELPSIRFQDAGSYVMRDRDLYLHFNANDCGLNGRGSHAHNDALSIEISAFGRPFIIDPGSYAYNLDREARQLFRSTEYHSTVMVDGVEQNTTNDELPFIMGNEARPVVDLWEVSDQRDRVSAEHFGYTRLGDPVRHRRKVEFDKRERYWFIEDKLTGKEKHKLSFAFHLAPGIEINDIDEITVRLSDEEDRRLYLRAVGIDTPYKISAAFTSMNYGHKENCSILRWEIITPTPFIARFIIVPSHENDASRLELLRRLTDNIDN